MRTKVRSRATKEHRPMKSRFLKAIAAGLLSCVAIYVTTVVASARAASSAPALEFRLPKDLPPLKDLQFVDADGRARTIADFRGKVLLLNIWATWCAPCRLEMPSLDRLQATLGGKEFQVIALSMDAGGLPDVMRFYARLGLRHLAIFVDPSGRTMPGLRISGLPTTLLIDRNGREIGRTAAPADWDQPEALTLIRRHLNNSPRAAAR